MKKTRLIKFKILYGKDEYLKNIIVADLKSTDKTKEIVKKLAEEYQTIKPLSWKECKDIMDNIISERKSKNIEDDYGIQNCWNKMIDILSKDINETVAYLENCSEKDIYFISEIFEDVSEMLQSKEYIECLRKLDDKFPDLHMTKDIDLVEEYI